METMKNGIPNIVINTVIMALRVCFMVLEGSNRMIMLFSMLYATQKI